MSVFEVNRQLAVMNEINRLITGFNRRQEACGLPPIDSSAGPADLERLSHMECLLNQIRGSVQLGETNATMVLSLAAQLVAWCVALEERDEVRIP